MKFERNLVANDLVIVSTSAIGQVAAILLAIIVSLHQTIPNFSLGDIDKSNTYMKFGRE